MKKGFTTFSLHERGFTFIELLVGISIIAVVAGIGLTIIASIVRSSTKTTIANQVKQNGDLAMETMVRAVRGAVDVCAQGTGIKIYDVQVANCSSVTTSPVIQFACTVGTLGSSNGLIQRQDNGGSYVAITNNTTNPKNGVFVELCNFSSMDNVVPKRVTLDFVLRQGATLPTTSEFTVRIPFHSEVTLRNF